MGQQIALLLTGRDLDTLQLIMKEWGDVVAYRDEPILGTDKLQLRSTFAASTSDPSLFFILAPTLPDVPIFIEEHSRSKSRVDVVKSYVIEFWAPYLDSNTIREGRLYVEFESFVEGTNRTKDDWFLRWSKRIFSRVRRNLRRNEQLQAYLGADAEELIKAGKLRVVR